jgi:hypothetical protein
VFIDTAVIHMLQVTVVEVIDVSLVPNGDMTAVRPVDVPISATGTISGGHVFSFPDYGDMGLMVRANR